MGKVSNLTVVTDPSSIPLINGLTIYGSNANGGNEKDQGGMARMRAAKDITIEGIGTDAIVDGWVFSNSLL